MTTTGTDLARFYADGRARLSTFMATLTDDELATAVPSCPGWTVQDVLAHVVSNPSDALAGRISGPPSDEFTAQQVERWRDKPLAEMLSSWDAANGIDAVIESFGDAVSALVIDLHTHEQDVRNAVGRPGARDVPGLLWAAERLCSGFTAAPIPVDGYEAFRARLGRRSRAQVTAWPWTVPDLDAALESFFIFGPRPDALVE